MNDDPHMNLEERMFGYESNDEPWPLEGSGVVDNTFASSERISGLLFATASSRYCGRLLLFPSSPQTDLTEEPQQCPT
jgi:hypothetical protein